MTNKFSVVPNWFNDLLEEWAREYSGRVVDLRAKSSTQIIWANKSASYLYSADERELVNHAFAEMERESPVAGSLIRFYYLCSSRVTMRDVETRFGISNRAAGEQMRAAEMGIYSFYVQLRRAA